MTFHYTNSSGLRGILETRTLRMHNVRYMNDATECSLFETALEPLLDADADKAFVGYLKLMLAERGDLYLVSFCKEDDLLNMWRNYARGDGFSLGFDQRRLIRDAMGSRNGASTPVSVKGSFGGLNDVRYGSEPAGEAAARIYGAMREHYARWRAIGEHTNENSPEAIRTALEKHKPMIFTEQREDLLRQIYAHKHSAFREEQEVRWVIPLQPAFDAGVLPYVTNDFKQYLKLEFEREALRSVRISPYASPDVYPGLRQFLNEIGFAHVALEYSSAAGVIR